jgi:hypothetical protein
VSSYPAFGAADRPDRSGTHQFSGRVYTVGHAEVICGNIQTANTTVYSVNKLLIPTS